jgi:hypothetical protein
MTPLTNLKFTHGLYLLVGNDAGTLHNAFHNLKKKFDGQIVSNDFDAYKQFYFEEFVGERVSYAQVCSWMEHRQNDKEHTTIAATMHPWVIDRFDYITLCEEYFNRLLFVMNGEVMNLEFSEMKNLKKAVAGSDNGYLSEGLLNMRFL